MSDLGELYQELILDHHKRPRNFRALSEKNRHAEGHNPLCGDNISLDVKLDGDVIRDIGFQGSGCAISTAAASLMTESVKGKTVAEAEKIFTQYHAMVTGQGDVAVDPDALGKIGVFRAVGEFPSRVKCATLAWHTLQAALHDARAPVTTE